MDMFINLNFNDNNITPPSEVKKYESDEIKKEFRDLKRRIKHTRKSRLEASKRLRAEHEFYEKITHIYSLILLVFSIWSLSNSNASTKITDYLLICSLSLTYFTLFLNIKNYKERATNFETNYQALDILTNKLDRYEACRNTTINTVLLKQFQREYEKNIVGKENHINLDYYISQYNSPSFEVIRTQKSLLGYYRVKKDSVNYKNRNDEGYEEFLTKKEKEENKLCNLNKLRTKILFKRTVNFTLKTLLTFFPIVILLLIKIFEWLTNWI